MVSCRVGFFISLSACGSGEHKHLYALPLVPQHTQYVIIVTDIYDICDGYLHVSMRVFSGE